MGIEETSPVCRWRRAALLAAMSIALATVCGLPLGVTYASTPPGFGATQGTGDDPCRFATAEMVGKAFGRAMKSSKRTSYCEYSATDGGLVVLKVTLGPEGTIMRHAKSVVAQGIKGPEKVATTVGEAYFDSSLPVFVGHVGNYDVQLETTIQPVPRDAMIAVGKRIMETLPAK